MATVLNVISDYNDIYTKLLIHSDNKNGSVEFLDVSDYRHTISTIGGVQHKIDQKKFMNSSIYFDGTGDYLSIPDHSGLKLGSNKFTIDFWIRADNITSNGIIINKSPGEHEIQISQSNANIILDASSNGTSWDIASSRTICTVSATTWTHIALERDGSAWKTYKDGTLSDTLTSSSTIYDEEGLLCIGGDGTTDYQGYIDEIRILNDCIYWSANFTPFKFPYEKDDIEPIVLYPYGSIEANIIKGTVKNSSGNPLERDVSCYFSKLDPDTDTEILEIYKTSVSNSSGDFRIHSNQKGFPLTIVFHGSSGENDVIYKDIIVI